MEWMEQKYLQVSKTNVALILFKVIVKSLSPFHTSVDELMMCKYCDKSFKADDILKHMIRTHGKIPVRFTSEEYEHLEEIVGNDTSVSILRS